MLSRLGHAGGLLRVHPAPLDGGQEAHGEHAGLLLWHQRTPAAAAVPRRHRSHWWAANNNTSLCPSDQLPTFGLQIVQHVAHQPFSRVTVPPVSHLCTDTVTQSKFPCDKAKPNPLVRTPCRHFYENALIIHYNQLWHPPLKPSQITIKLNKVRVALLGGGLYFSSHAMMSWGVQWGCILIGCQPESFKIFFHFCGCPVSLYVLTNICI